MRTAFAILTYAAVVACVSATASLQVNAADDSDARAGSLVVVGNTDAPSMTDSADVAFRKLDRGAKGYVTYEDVAVLPDFATAFGNADSTHLGRLNLAGFTQAWAAYAKGRN